MSTFNEQDHPRADNGRFGEGGGAGGGSGGEGEGSEPKKGPFGPILTQFHHDAQGAIKKLTELKDGEAVGALHHPEVGDIDLVWGKEGTPEEEHKDGYGLAKIATKHPEVLENLQGILSSMKKNDARSGPNRTILESPDHKAIVALNWFDQKKTWLISEFKKNDDEKRGDGADQSLTSTGLDGGVDGLSTTASDAILARIAEYYKASGAPGTAEDKSILDTNGFREISNNPLSKVGVFPYSGRSLTNAPDPNKKYMVYRPAEELSDPECIESFRLLPWVDNHAMLGSEDEGLTPAEKKGVQGVIGEDVYFKNGTLYGNLKVFSQSLANLIEAGKRELSCGYRCTYEWTPGTFDGQRYDVVQREIRGNHLALVESGRMGPGVAVMDGLALDQITFTFDAKEIAMENENTAPEGGGGAPALSLQDALKVIEQLMPAITAIQQLAASNAVGAPAAGDGDPPPPAGNAPDNGNPDDPPPDVSGDQAPKPSCDADPAKPEPGKLDPDDKKDAKGAGMDAFDIKRVFAQVSARDRLARQLSEHIGTFDHAEMTETEVARYGIGKLGIKAEAGQEMAVLGGYLQGRAVPRKQPVAQATDSANADNFVTRHLKGGK